MPAAGPPALETLDGAVELRFSEQSLGISVFEMGGFRLVVRDAEQDERRRSEWIACTASSAQIAQYVV